MKYFRLMCVLGAVCALFVATTPCCKAEERRTTARGGVISYSPVKLTPHPNSRLDSSKAQVTDQSFSLMSRERGLWRGLVRGHGNIQLRLMILRNGIVESTRRIGSVLQKEWEKPTPFFFTTSLPKGTDWSWSIVAKVS
jgi:hypothetical protein